MPNDASELHAFDFHPRTRIVYGPESVDRLGALARELGAARAMVVSDPGIVKAGHTQRGLDALQQAGLATALFQDVVENPTTKTVASGVQFAQDFRPDLIVGLGGGSAMDAAKGVNFLFTNGGKMQDYWGRDKAQKPMLPMIAVPTTAGTGSEAQSYALISDAETHVKMACGDKKAACKIAVLDPTLTVTQPPRVTALTGVDALTHALETWVTNVRNPISLAFSREAWRLLHVHLHRVLETASDLEARGAMQVGACWAGSAIENSMLGAAHATANPLTARYKVVHGQAVAVMMPHVIRFNAVECEPLYRELTSSTASEFVPASGGSAALAEFIQKLSQKAGLATNLKSLGVEEAALPQLAADAMKQWTAGFNPRKVTEEKLLEIYRAAYN